MRAHSPAGGNQRSDKPRQDPDPARHHTPRDPDTSALTDLARGEPPDTTQTAKAPRKYLGLHDLCDLVDVTENSLRNIRDNGMLPDPDIRIGPSSGWDPERAFRWGVETGRLDNAGNPLRRKAGRPPKGFTPPDWWKVPHPRVYLSSTGAALKLGLEANSLYLLRERGNFITADVIIGDRLGWSPDRVVQFGAQTGRLNPDGSRIHPDPRDHTSTHTGDDVGECTRTDAPKDSST